MKTEERDEAIAIFLMFSLVPLFPDPLHPEKYGGEFRRVMFWEWLAKELWEIWTGIELVFRFKENYELMYGGTDYRGKVVLDIGADIGSTAKYFLAKGARHVIAVEASPRYYSRLQITAQKLGQITPILLTVEKPQNIHELIHSYSIDTVKIDCEGCEKVLLGLGDNAFASIPEYIMEIHNDALFNNILDKLQKNRYVTTKLIIPFPTQPHIRIIHAEKQRF